MLYKRRTLHKGNRGSEDAVKMERENRRKRKMIITEAQLRAMKTRAEIEKCCAENGINLTIYNGKIGFVDPKEHKIVLSWDAQYPAEPPQEKVFTPKRDKIRAEIHITQQNTDGLPRVRIKGTIEEIGKAFCFGMASMIEKIASDQGRREEIEEFFRRITEGAIEISRI